MDRETSGRPTKLDSGVVAIIKEWLANSPQQTFVRIREHLRREHGIRVGRSPVGRWFRSVGFTHKRVNYRNCYRTKPIGPITYDQCAIYKMTHCLREVIPEIEHLNNELSCRWRIDHRLCYSLAFLGTEHLQGCQHTTLRKCERSERSRVRVCSRGQVGC